MKGHEKKGRTHCDLPARSDMTQVNLGSSINNGEWDKVLAAVVGGADVNDTANTCHSPNALHSAIQAGRNDIVDALLRLGADPNKSDALNYGRRPLDIAVQRLNVEAIDLLVKAGADVNGKGPNGCTALAHACSLMPGATSINSQRRLTPGGLVNVVARLLDQGADPNIGDDDGNTALHRAMLTRHIDLVGLLMKRGADATLTNNEKLSAVDMARRCPSGTDAKC